MNTKSIVLLSLVSLFAIAGCDNTENTTNSNSVAPADSISAVDMSLEKEPVKEEGIVEDNSQTKLVQADLNVLVSLTRNGKTEYFANQEGKLLTTDLSIELIDKSVFDSKLNTAINFVTADTTLIKKKDGVIDLPCENKNKKYVDKPTGEEGLEEYSYIGQIEFLNKYLIRARYWESFDYLLIDKMSGEETQKLIQYPYVSPDQKNVICVYTEDDDVATYLALYSIIDKKLKKIMVASFKYWMPDGKIFWSTDGYLYLTVLPSDAVFKQEGIINDQWQYIRIKVL